MAVVTLARSPPAAAPARHQGLSYTATNLTVVPMGLRCISWVRAGGGGGSYVTRPARCGGMARTA